jgi:hypothetical protein
MVAGVIVDRRRQADAMSGPAPAEQIRDLARRVRRMGLNGRLDPELAFLEREELSDDLDAMARALERQSEEAVRPAQAKPMVNQRLASILISQKQRIAILEAQLAQANRPRPRRRERRSDNQLSLPLPEEPDGPKR